MTDVNRRTVLWAGIGLALGQTDAASNRPSVGDVFVKAGDTARTPLTPADILPGAAQLLAWPMDPTDGTVRSGSRLNQVILLRLDPDTLSPDTRARRRRRRRVHVDLHAHRVRRRRLAAERAAPGLSVSFFAVRSERRREGRRRSRASAAAGAAAENCRRTTGGRAAVHRARRLRKGVI